MFKTVKITKNDIKKIKMLMFSFAIEIYKTRPAMHPSLVENIIKRRIEARFAAADILYALLED